LDTIWQRVDKLGGGKTEVGECQGEDSEEFHLEPAVGFPIVNVSRYLRPESNIEDAETFDYLGRYELDMLIS
jgi:hypothetical protein